MNIPRAWLASLLLLGLGCKPTQGGTCLFERSGQCTADGKEMAVCKAHKWQMLPCRGADGCAAKGAKTVCDQTLALAFDACLPGDACSVDGKQWLQCKDGRFANHDHCEGPEHCAVVPSAAGLRQIRCDKKIARQGDACTRDKDAACTADGQTELTCREGHYELRSHCRGPTGCSIDGETIQCDKTLADRGDPCYREGLFACSVDRQSELVCAGGMFVVRSACNRQGGCDIHDRVIRCTALKAGGACPLVMEGTFACQSDLQAIIACKSGVFALVNACPNGCEDKDHSVRCK